MGHAFVFFEYAMSENDSSLMTVVNSQHDSPKKILKKIIYSPTSSSDMLYDSLAHIDTLMGGSPQEDLGIIVARAEYGYESPDSPDYPGMKESIIVRSRIYDLIEQSKGESNQVIPNAVQAFSDIKKQIGQKIEV